MSKSTESQIAWLETLSAQLRGRQVSGVCGQKTNINLWRDAYLLWCALLLDIRSSDGCRLEMTDFYPGFEQGEATISAMKNLLLRLRTYYVWPGTRYRSFKRSLLHSIGGLHAIVNLIDPLLESHFRNPSGSTFRPLNDILSFLSRIPLKAEGLESAAISKFLAADDIVVTATSDEISAVNSILRAWIGDFQPDLSYGFHGPGASAGLRRRDSYPDAKYSRRFTTQLMEFIGCPKDDSLPRISNPEADIVFVPKTADSLRTICKIPAGYMYPQQAVQRQLYAYVEHSPLARHLKFSDQAPSRRMALKGSRDDSYYTIDLSSASDTISWEVVKKTFRGTPLLRVLFALRTRCYRLPDGTTTVPNKFDPMGSALTFPVESLLFSAICESTASCKNPRFRVYGDDIVCHPEDIDAKALIARLQRFGFSVNADKSYTAGPFREACGMEAYNGEDVSPLRLSRFFRGLVVKPDNLASLRELANAMAWRGYKYARLLVIRRVLARYASCIPFSLEGEQGRWQSFSATNYRLQRRYNDALQRTEVRVIQERCKALRGKEDWRYLDWMSQRYHESVVIPRITQCPWDPDFLPRELSGGGPRSRKYVRAWWPERALGGPLKG